MICENCPHDVGTLIDTDQRQHITGIRHSSGRFSTTTRVEDLPTGTSDSQIAAISLQTDSNDDPSTLGATNFASFRSGCND